MNVRGGSTILHTLELPKNYSSFTTTSLHLFIKKLAKLCINQIKKEIDYKLQLI